MNTIRLSKSVVGPRETAAVAAVIERGYLGMGDETRQFENELSEYFGGQRYVACVSTGTAALHLALQACGVGRGDDVLVPSLTFLSSFQAITGTGATPVACEVRVADCTLDVEDAKRRLTANTKAIMPVHYASEAGDLDAVYQFAQDKGLRVVEDAAHAFGCYYQERLVGSFGDVTCFSFDGIKNITSGEGGAVVTGDQRVNQHVQDARLLGVRKDTEKRYSGARSWEFDVVHQGYRYHMSDIMAAIGRTQLRRFEEEFKPSRVGLAQRYRKMLDNVPGIRLLSGTPGPVVPHIFPIRVLDGHRDRVRRILTEQGCEVGIHYMPNHLLSYFGATKGALSVTESLYEELVTLPLHPELAETEQDRVVAMLAETLEDCRVESREVTR